MINHLFATLYNLQTPTASGVIVPAELPLRVPDVLASAMLPLRGTTAVTAEAFAVHAVKVVDASTYRAEVLAYDPRLTYDAEALGTAATNSADFITAVRQLSPAGLSYVWIGNAELQQTWARGSTLEAAAAVIVGLARRISEANGYG